MVLEGGELSRIESMLDDCQELLERDDDRLSAWEVDFLESVIDQDEFWHLSVAQVEKLEEIWERYCA